MSKAIALSDSTKYERNQSGDQVSGIRTRLLVPGTWSLIYQSYTNNGDSTTCPKQSPSRIARNTNATVPGGIGVFLAGDPRIDADSRQRCRNICEMVADTLAERVKLPDGSPAKVVWAPTLVDGEPQADLVAKQFQDANVKVLVCAPDTWAFPQLSVISLLQQFPKDTPINFTCGNSGPKPGVVFAHAVNGALAQYGRLSHLNVGTWPDTGLNPQMTEGTSQALVDWA